MSRLSKYIPTAFIKKKDNNKACVSMGGILFSTIVGHRSTGLMDLPRDGIERKKFY